MRVQGRRPRRSSTSFAPTASRFAYLDASALVKLVFEEPESARLRHALNNWPRRVTSRIAVVEVIRGVRRADPRLVPVAARALTGVVLLATSDHVLRWAAQLEPAMVPTLDAIHLTSALRVRGSLDAFVSYDRTQLDAASALGLPAVAPR